MQNREKETVVGWGMVVQLTKVKVQQDSVQSKSLGSIVKKRCKEDIQNDEGDVVKYWSGES